MFREDLGVVRQVSPFHHLQFPKISYLEFGKLQIAVDEITGMSVSHRLEDLVKALTKYYVEAPEGEDQLDEVDDVFAAFFYYDYDSTVDLLITRDATRSPR